MCQGACLWCVNKDASGVSGLGWPSRFVLTVVESVSMSITQCVCVCVSNHKTVVHLLTGHEVNVCVCVCVHECECEGASIALNRCLVRVITPSLSS